MQLFSKLHENWFNPIPFNPQRKFHTVNYQKFSCKVEKEEFGALGSKVSHSS